MSSRFLIRSVANLMKSIEKLFREDCESLAMALTKRGVPCLAYHAGLKDSDRSQVQEDWMDGKVAGSNRDKLFPDEHSSVSFL